MKTAVDEVVLPRSPTIWSPISERPALRDFAPKLAEKLPRPQPRPNGEVKDEPGASVEDASVAPPAKS